jgi:hypothetical protein
MLRRSLLATTMLIPPVVALVGCNGLSQSQAVQDVQLIAADMSNVQSALSAAGVNVSAAVQAQITASEAALTAQANTIANSLMPAASLFDNFGSALTALGAVVAPFYPAAPLIAAAVQAAMVLLQSVLASVHGTAAASAGMTPDQARAVLKQGMK